MNNIFYDKNNYYSILYVPTDDEEGIIEEEKYTHKKEKNIYIIYCLDKNGKKIKKRRKFINIDDYIKTIEMQVKRVEKFIKKINKKYKKWLKDL